METQRSPSRRVQFQFSWSRMRQVPDTGAACTTTEGVRVNSQPPTPNSQTDCPWKLGVGSWKLTRGTVMASAANRSGLITMAAWTAAVRGRLEGRADTREAP